jgi:hypothetical protein
MSILEECIFRSVQKLLTQNVELVNRENLLTYCKNQEYDILKHEDRLRQHPLYLRRLRANNNNSVDALQNRQLKKSQSLPAPLSSYVDTEAASISTASTATETVSSMGQFVHSIQQLPTDAWYQTPHGLHIKRWGDTLLLVKDFPPINLVPPPPARASTAAVASSKEETQCKARKQEYKQLSTAALLSATPLLLYREDVHLLVQTATFPHSKKRQQRQYQKRKRPTLRAPGPESKYSKMLAENSIPSWALDKNGSAGVAIDRLDHLPLQVMLISENGLRVCRINATVVRVEGFDDLIISRLDPAEQMSLEKRRGYFDNILTGVALSITDAVTTHSFNFSLPEMTSRPVSLQNRESRRETLLDCSFQDREEELNGEELGLSPDQVSPRSVLFPVPAEQEDYPVADTIILSPHKKEQVPLYHTSRIRTFFATIDNTPKELGGGMQSINLMNEEDDRYYETGETVYGCEKSRDLLYSFTKSCDCSRCIAARRTLRKSLPSNLDPGDEILPSWKELGITVLGYQDDSYYESEEGEECENTEEEEEEEEEEEDDEYEIEISRRLNSNNLAVPQSREEDGDDDDDISILFYPSSLSKLADPDASNTCSEGNQVSSSSFSRTTSKRSSSRRRHKLERMSSFFKNTCHIS